MPFGVLTTLASVNVFFYHCLVDFQLLNLQGLEKLDFMKWFFDATNQNRDISTDSN